MKHYLSAAVAAFAVSIAVAPSATADVPAEKGIAQASSERTAVGCGSKPADVDQRSYSTLFAYDGVNIRSGPTTSCTVLGRGYLNDKLDYHCFDIGQEVNGYTTWTYLRNVSTGKYGWVSDSLLDKNADGIRGSLVLCQ